MWKNKTVSVVFPTYNEKESIYQVIQEFFHSGYVDEIVVVNNNAAPGTKEEVEKTEAVQVFEKEQGYGYAIRRGLKESKGDIIIVSEPDGTFIGKDLLKLLAYSDDFEVVFGTRTSKHLILKDANMGIFLKYGNWALAKIVEVLFNTTCLTDVGCTMRLIKRNALNKIENRFSTGKSVFGLEMMLLIFLHKLKYIEIPVNYNKRVGKSSVTGSRIKAFLLGLQMFLLVLQYRLKYLTPFKQ